MAYQTGTIAGTFHELDGSPTEAGHVYVSLTGITPARVKDTAGDVVLSGHLHQELTAGVVTFEELPATDEDALNPTGFGYLIEVRIPGRDTIRVTTDLPAGSTVQIEDLLDAPPATFDPQVTYLSSSDIIDGGVL